MFSIKTLCSLLFLVLLLGPIHGLDITPTIIKDSQPRKFLKFSSSDYRPINITFDHSNTDANVTRLPESSFMYLNNTIFSPVQYFLKSAIKVLPRNSKIFAKPDVCKDAVKIPDYASETGFDSDLVIFVKTTSDKIYGYDDIFVQGAACGLDETTGRPIVGVLTFGDVTAGGWYSPFETERRIAFTIHEIVHVLGFRDTLFPYFINPDTLQPLTGHFFNKTVNDVNTLVLNVAPLTQRVRSYFNCPTAEGAYLENQGDNLTMSSHFERRIFGHELMTAGEVFDRRISQFTLALLEGTGWYKVDYSLAEPMSYGKNEGCAFLDTKCMDPVTLKPNFKEFCSPLTVQGVSWTKRGYGFCGADPVWIKHEVDPNMIAAFDYWGNKTAVEDKYSDNCPSYFTPYRSVVIQVPQEFDCENEFAPTKMQEYESRSPGSKAFMGTLAYYSKYPSAYGGHCFKPKCVSKADGNYEIQVPFGSAGVVNCTAAGFINASDFGFKHFLVGELECPNPNEFCESILADKFCRAGCFGNGVCSDRECQCKEGWGFRSCERKYEVDRSSRCTKDPLRTTAYGDDCICSGENKTCQCLLGLKTGDECKQIIDENNKKNNEEKNNNSSGNQPTGGYNRAIYLAVGLVVVVIAIVCIKRRKQADDLNTALVQGRRSHDISAF